MKCSLQRCSNFAASSLLSTKYLIAYGAVRKVAATLHGGCKSWLQLQRYSNIVATSNFQLNIQLHEVYFATFLQRCLEVGNLQRTGNSHATLRSEERL